MFWTDLTTAFRRLRRRPTYALLNGVGLTLALAACLLIGLYTWEELRVNTGYEHADRIMVMGLESPFFGPTTATPAPLAPLLEEQSPHVERVARTGSAQKKPLARVGERPGGQYRVLPADSSFTALFSFEAVHGTVETALDQPDAAVLTERVARQYFGEQNPVGEMIRVGRGEEATTRTVRAVIENPPSASTLQFDVLVPLTAPPSQGGWGRAMYGTYALLHQPMTETAFTEHVTRLVEERVEKAPSYSILATTLPDLYLSELHSADGFWGQWSYLYIFGSAALLLLLIACINYVNLATARGLQRGREIGVRKTLGATQGHLARLLVGEAVILVGIATVVAVGLAALVLPAFNGLFGTELAWSQLPLGRLGLGLLGLVGLSAYVVQRRTKEIGVRKALGATVSGIVLRLNREFLVLLGVALVVAAPVAYLVAEQWLATFAYRIGVSPLVFLGAGGVALVASLAAASYQAWTTARIDPAEALRQE